MSNIEENDISDTLDHNGSVLPEKDALRFQDRREQDNGRWWRFSDIVSAYVPSIALEETRARYLIKCPICGRSFSSQSLLETHLGAPVIDNLYRNPRRVIKMRKSPHIFIEPGIQRQSQKMKSFAESIGLNTLSAVDVLRHSRLITFKDVLTGPDLNRAEWRDIWNRKLKVGLGEAMLHKFLVESIPRWARYFKVEGLRVEWASPLQTHSVGKRTFGASQADSMLYAVEGGRHSLVFPAESKMWGDMRSSIIQKSFENVAYSTLITFSRIDGYLLLVPQGFLVGTYIKYMIKKGTISKKLADGTVMEYKFTSTGKIQEVHVEMRLMANKDDKISQNTNFQGSFTYFIEFFPITHDQATAYIAGLMDSMDSYRGGLASSPPTIPGPMTTSGVRVTRHVKSLRRYDDVLLAIARATTAGYPISNVGISRLLGIPVESLKRLFESLVNSGQIRQIEMEPPIHVPARQERSTYYSNWIEATTNMKATWYALPESRSDPQVDMAMKERSYRTKVHESLEKSSFVLDVVNHLFNEISTHTRADVRKAALKDALTRWIELLFDDLFYATGIRLGL